MSTKITSNSSEASNGSAATKLETGFYWVRIDDSWFLTQYYSRKELFYFPGYFDGFGLNELHEIDKRRLDKKFVGHKRKVFDIIHQTESSRPEGYYWVLHDAMWFASYYLPSKNEFFFPGQIYGFDPAQLDEIDEQQIVI